MERIAWCRRRRSPTRQRVLIIMASPPPTSLSLAARAWFVRDHSVAHAAPLVVARSAAHEGLGVDRAASALSAFSNVNGDSGVIRRCLACLPPPPGAIS